MATSWEAKSVSRLAIKFTPAQRHALSFVFTLLAWGLMALSALLFRPANNPSGLLEAALLMLSGGLALGIAIIFNRTSLLDTRESRRVTVVEAPAKTQPPARFATLRPILARLIFVLGAASLLVLIEINGNFIGIPALQQTSLRAQFLLLCAGVVLVVVGLGLNPAAHTQGSVGTRYIVSRWTRYELVAVVVITLLALALRLWRLEDAVHKFVDEIHFSTAAADVLDNRTPGIRLLSPFAGITAFPWLYPYWQSEVASLNGRNLESLRLVSAILGTLTIPAAYLLARTLFDRMTAVMAALLLATFPPHLHFSRVGLNNIADPLFGTLALAFLARGLKSGRRLDFALAGGALGLTQYFYEGGRLLFPPLLVGWLVVIWVLRIYRPYPLSLAAPAHGKKAVKAPRPEGEGFGVRARHNLAVLALAGLLIGLPVYTTLLAEHKPVAARMDTVALGGTYHQRVVELGTPQTMREQVTRPFLVYVHMPETGVFYGGRQPLILETLVPVFLLGVFVLLWRARQPGIVVLLWVLLTSAGNMLMTEGAIFARYVVAFPALAILLALGLRYTLPLLWPGRRWWPVVMILLAVAISLAQVRYYFGPHLALYNAQLHPGYDGEDAMFRAAAFPVGTQVHLISSSSLGQQYLSGVLGYLKPGLTLDVRTPLEVTPDYAASLMPGVTHVFFVEPTDVNTLGLLKQHFDLGEPQFSPYNISEKTQLVMYYVEGHPEG